MLAVLKIWSVAFFLWVVTAAERNEKPNVVIMLMDDVSCRSCGKFSNKLCKLITWSSQLQSPFTSVILNPSEGVTSAVYSQLFGCASFLYSSNVI